MFVVQLAAPSVGTRLRANKHKNCKDMCELLLVILFIKEVKLLNTQYSSPCSAALPPPRNARGPVARSLSIREGGSFEGGAL